MKTRKYVNEYKNNEINEIISLYESGTSMTAISEKLDINRKVIKKILIQNNVWIENRDDLKIEFSEEDKKNILDLYINKKLSAQKIGVLYNTCKGPIKRLLNEYGVLRKGYSDGKKIELTELQKESIKNLYLNEYKNAIEIGKILGVSEGYINKFLQKNRYTRSRSEATKLSVTGRKVSKKGIENMKRGQKNLVLSGKRKQNGGVCKRYKISGLKCQGTYEKSYIENLIKNNENLPKNGELIITPFGGYYPDFKYENKFTEIKSTYTYDILIGNKKNYWNNKYDDKQLKKIKWVNDNILPVEIVIIDKNNIKEIKTL